PESLTILGSYAFNNCTSLASVALGTNVASIGDGTFNQCTNLTDITIPKSVTNIGFQAFQNCSHLTAITVAASNPVYSSVAGVLFNKDVTTLIECPGGKASVTIANSVTNIESQAFFSCLSLTDVTFGSSVASIGGS